MLNLKEFRSGAKGLADLLNWGSLVEDGVVLCKDGSLLAGWVYRGEDMGAASPNERNYQTSIVNAALARMGSGWACWFESARVPAPHYPEPEESYFPDPVTLAIDEERRRQFESRGTLYVTEQVLLVSYLPPSYNKTKIADYLYDDDAAETDPGMRLLARFQLSLNELEGALSGVLKMRRLGSYTHTNEEGREILRDQLLNYLSFCLTGETDPVNVPPSGGYLDSYLVADEFWTGITPKIGNNFIYAVALEGYPAESYPGLMDMLEGMAVRYRWSSRFIFMDSHQSVSELNSFRKAWRMKQRGFFSQVFKTNSGPVNEDALLMASEAQTALSQAEGGLVTFGYYTPVIVLMGENRDDTEENAIKIVNEMKRRGVRGRVETINAVEAFFGSLPGHTIQNVRRPLMHTLNLADMLPLASVWPGRDTNPCDFYPPNSPPLFLAATTGSTPFRFNWHVGQLGHGLILGPTRAGKSTLLALCVAQFRRYPGARITAFDKGNSLYALTTAVGSQYGARHYDVGADDSSLAFAPLSHLDTEEDRSWAVAWVEKCFNLQTGKLPVPHQVREIENAINQLLSAPQDQRSITHFCSAVQDEDVRAAMQYYTLGKAGGHLLDEQVDGLDDATFRVFEIEHLLRLDAKIFIPTMSYIIQRFIVSLDGKPAMLVIDEAWTLLKDEDMRKQVEEWFRVLAKANCIVILATQSLTDAVSSGFLPLLVESCATKVFLPNPEAKNPNIASVYREFGFSDTELDIIANATRQRQYYVNSFDGKRLIDLGLGPLTLSFVGASSKEDVNNMRSLSEQYGDKWPLEWTKRRDCSTILSEVYQAVELAERENMR